MSARAYLKEARYETVRMLRTPAFAGPFLLLPILLYLLFGVVLFGAAVRGDRNAAAFLFTAFTVFGVVGPALFGFGATMAIEREQGLLRLKRALPMPPAAYLLAKTLMAMLFAALVLVTVLPAAPALGHLRLTAGQILAVTAVDVLGAVPFCAIGLFIGALASAKSAIGFVNLAYFPMLYLSGLFFPLPGFLKTLAPVWPTYHLTQLALSAVGAPSAGSPWAHAGVLAGLTLLLGGLALRRLDRAG